MRTGNDFRNHSHKACARHKPQQHTVVFNLLDNATRLHGVIQVVFQGNQPVPGHHPAPLGQKLLDLALGKLQELLEQIRPDARVRVQQDADYVCSEVCERTITLKTLFSMNCETRPCMERYVGRDITNSQYPMHENWPNERRFNKMERYERGERRLYVCAPRNLLRCCVKSSWP